MSLPQIPLTELPIGNKARLASIQGDKALVRRLMGLGLRVGAELSLVYRRRGGLVVATNGNRIALDSEIGKHLMMQAND